MGWVKEPSRGDCGLQTGKKEDYGHLANMDFMLFPFSSANRNEILNYSATRKRDRGIS